MVAIYFKLDGYFFSFSFFGPDSLISIKLFFSFLDSSSYPFHFKTHMMHYAQSFILLWPQLQFGLSTLILEISPFLIWINSTNAHKREDSINVDKDSN